MAIRVIEKKGDVEIRYNDRSNEYLVYRGGKFLIGFKDNKKDEKPTIAQRRALLIRDGKNNLVKAELLADGLYTLVDTNNNKEMKLLIGKKEQVVKIFTDEKHLNIKEPLTATSGSDNMLMAKLDENNLIGFYKYKNHLYIVTDRSGLILLGRWEFLITKVEPIPTEIYDLIGQLSN